MALVKAVQAQQKADPAHGGWIGSSHLVLPNQSARPVSGTPSQACPVKFHDVDSGLSAGWSESCPLSFDGLQKIFREYSGNTQMQVLTYR